MENQIVLLLGPRYTGKSTAVKMLRGELGEFEHVELYTPDGGRNLEGEEKAREMIFKGLLKGKAVIEGTAYRLAYALYAQPEYAKWVREKDCKVNEILSDRRTLKVELGSDDVAKLLEHFGARDLDDAKREQLARLASWRGQTIIPLLKEVAEEYGRMSSEELREVVEAEEKLEGFVERMLLIERESWSNVGRKVIDLLVEIVEIVAAFTPATAPVAGILEQVKEREREGQAKGVASLFFGFSTFRLVEEGRYSNLLQLREAWNRLREKKRIAICEELDEKIGSPPGSSFEFLNSWLASDRQFLEVLARVPS